MADTSKVVAAFLRRYEKEFDFYQEAAGLAAARCENLLGIAGIRAIVTSRAKRSESLRTKVLSRNLVKKYRDLEHVSADIVDLAGVRIALYFPGDLVAAHKLVEQAFLIESIKIFPDGSTSHPGGYTKRFMGYNATHFRVRLRDEDLGPSQKRFADAQIEIQVASVLMHAWAEVEHDLVYKPTSGILSQTEYAILDEINGLVLAGELALENLQRAVLARVNEQHREFNNHYELAAYLLNLVGSKAPHDEQEPMMGRVDLLLRFLELTDLATPDDLRQFVDSLDIDSRRPIAEQIIDAILAGDVSHYKAYRLARSEIGSRNPYSSSEELERIRAPHSPFEHFLRKWILFERAVSAVRHPQTIDRFEPPTFERVKELGLFDDVELVQIAKARGLRNSLVHGTEIPSSSRLEDGAGIIDRFLKKLLPKLPPQLATEVNEALKGTREDEAHRSDELDDDLLF